MNKKERRKREGCEEGANKENKCISLTVTNVAIVLLLKFLQVGRQVSLISQSFHKASATHVAREHEVAGVHRHVSSSARVRLEHLVTVRTRIRFFVLDHFWQLCCTYKGKPTQT